MFSLDLEKLRVKRENSKKEYCWHHHFLIQFKDFLTSLNVNEFPENYLECYLHYHKLCEKKFSFPLLENLIWNDANIITFPSWKKHFTTKWKLYIENSRNVEDFLRRIGSKIFLSFLEFEFPERAINQGIIMGLNLLYMCLDVLQHKVNWRLALLQLSHLVLAVQTSAHPS